MNQTLKNTLPTYIATLILFILTYLLTTSWLIFAVTLCVVVVALINSDLRLTLLLAFVIGFVSDMSLNVSSNIINKNFTDTKRSKALQTYFKSMGILPAAIFGGVLAAMMVATTYAITQFLPEDTSIGWIFLIGFGVGALWGAVGDGSLGMKKFQVFYQSTSGYLESRFWDGITIPFVLFWIYLVSVSSSKFEFELLPSK